MQTLNQLVLNKYSEAKAKAEQTRASVEAGTFDVDFTVRVSGKVTIGEDYLTTPTVSIPLKETLALFVARAGFTREKSMALLLSCVTDALNAGKAGAQGEIAASIPAVNEALEVVQNEVIAKLPKVSRTGPVTMKIQASEIVSPIASGIQMASQ